MGKKVAIYVADGTEPIEAIAPADILSRGGCDVTLVSAMDSVDVALAQDIKIVAATTVDAFSADDFDMLVVPGGTVGVNNLAKCTAMIQDLKGFAAAGRFIASICAGPTILAANGLLDGRKATCYPGCEQGVFPVGVYQGEDVVVDGNLITAAGPGVAYAFGLACLEALMGKDVAASVAAGMLIK